MSKIRFNIAGAFSKKDQLMMFFFKNKDILNDYSFTVYDGINNCKWNGGRINRDIQFDQQAIDFYYRNRISIALTFTNPIIDIKDPVGNLLLEKFHQEENYIISVNDELRDYIKSEFPKYKHTRSITGHGCINSPMTSKDVEWYKSLEDKYDVIVPRSEHIFDQMFTSLSQHKYEIMLNDTCMYNCPFYDQHFKMIALQNTLYTKPWRENSKVMESIEECWLPNFDPDVGHEATKNKLQDDYGMDLTNKQMQRLIGRGVTDFKITGREMKYGDFEHELNTYLKNIKLCQKS